MRRTREKVEIMETDSAEDWSQWRGRTRLRAGLWRASLGKMHLHARAHGVERVHERVADHTGAGTSHDVVCVPRPSGKASSGRAARNSETGPQRLATATYRTGNRGDTAWQWPPRLRLRRPPRSRPPPTAPARGARSSEQQCLPSHRQRWRRIGRRWPLLRVCCSSRFFSNLRKSRHPSLVAHGCARASVECGVEAVARAEQRKSSEAVSRPLVLR